MKVALVIPRVSNMAVIPSLGLGYLAGMMRQSGVEFKLFHCGKDKLGTHEIVGLLDAGRFDIAGIQSLTYFHRKAVDIAKGVKARRPSTLVVTGGAHASGVREMALAEEPSFDFGFAGEAETGFTEFIKQVGGGNMSPENIPGLIWRDGGRCVSNNIQSTRDLDSLPMPPWDLINPKSYPHQAYGIFPPGFPVAPVIFSRGCNYNCSFCAGRSISGPGVRYRSVENMMDEITYLHNELRINTFAFLDQNITANKVSIMNLCAALIKAGMGLKWYCPNGVHLDSLDDEILGAMRAAGCESLTVGVESASEKSLAALNRAPALDNLRHRIDSIKKHGIKVTGNFIIGLPDEHLRDFNKTIATSLRLNLDRAQFAFFVPFPGTSLFSKYFPSPEPGSVNWDAFDINVPAFVKNVPAFTAWIAVLSALVFFYLRPGVMYKNIRDLKSPGHIYFILARISVIPMNMMKWGLRGFKAYTRER